MNTSMNVDKIKPYFLPIAALGVLIILAPLVILPWVTDVRTSYADMGTRQTKLSAMQEKADALEHLNNQTNKQLLQEKVSPAIPDQADPAGVLGTLEQVAVASGAVAKGVHFGAATTAPTKSTTAGTSVTASLSVEGSYASIMTFIMQSESVARVLSLSTLHIVPTTAGSLTATFDVVSPFQPLPTDLGPSEEPLPAQTPSKTKTLQVVNGLHQASYTPTALVNITGKQNPF